MMNYQYEAGKENSQSEESSETGRPVRVWTDEDRQRVRERREVLQRRLRDPEAKKTFRNAYCFKAGYDYSALGPYCENLIMVSDGMTDHIDNTRRKLEQGLSDYDSDKDVLVMAGRVIEHMLAGQIVTQKVLQKSKPYQSYAIAMYLNPNYIFYEIFLDPTVESREVAVR